VNGEGSAQRGVPRGRASKDVYVADVYFALDVLAFPRSVRHGLRWLEVDLMAYSAGMAEVGPVSDVVDMSPGDQRTKEVA